MASENETIADIVAQMREHYVKTDFHDGDLVDATTAHHELLAYAAKLEAARKREQELLRSCARWISTHDIYGNMAKELLAECKKVLGDDGKFLMPKGVMS